MENINPSSYKDHFTIPLTFDDAWNHPDPFQRKKWREAIGTEFQKWNKWWFGEKFCNLRCP